MSASWEPLHSALGFTRQRMWSLSPDEPGSYEAEFLRASAVALDGGADYPWPRGVGASALVGYD
jgi:hypothetical protein